jgi:dihydrodipicolinate synthase/N-acetylneuraminate lyase
MLRRNFLLTLAAAPAWAAGANKPLRGIFPIMQTPFTDSDKLDIEILVREAQFLDKIGSHGMVWPQLASEWSVLRPEERRAGAEALAKAARFLKPALVLGVQGPTKEAAVEYARHADKLMPDAIIALPPKGIETPDSQFEYYKAIGGASSRPLFIQAIGKMPVEFIIEMTRAIPTMRYIKDEAGPPLPRITEFRRKAPELFPFTGAHGRTLFDEMMRGSFGSMPAAGFTDLYAQGWDLFQAGKRRESLEMCARATVLIPMVETYGMRGMKYILQVRGVFKNDIARNTSTITVNDRNTQLDDEGRAAIREVLSLLKPWLRG